MDFDAAVARLYGVAPGDFVATRNELAAQAAKEDPALAKRLRGLRRPTVSAWAVNRLARSATDEVGWLLDVGAQLREAWTAGDHIGGIEQRRSELIARLVRMARDAAAGAGQPLREPAVREVEETLQAATIDPDVAADVKAGRLDRPRSHAGFGPGLFAPAQAAPGRKRAAAGAQAKRRPAGRDRAAELSRLEDEHRTAADDAAAARRDLSEWDEQVEEARREVAAADEKAERLRRALDEARDRQAAANRRLQVVRRERNRAARAAETAGRRADEARGRLDRARAG
ncbi:MAG TPA: hypothetical protein VF069_19965 [Streptosporangiaceae bacterium]